MDLSDADWAAVFLSLQVAAVCTVGVLPPAIGIAFLLARYRFPGKSILDAAVHLPLVLPPVVVGYLLLTLMGRKGAIGSRLEEWFGIVVAFKWTGAVIASAVMALPLAVGAIRVAIEAVDPQLERAARGLGAGRVRTFLFITLPLAAPGVIAGAVLAFAKSLGEFGATITFVSNIPFETQTIPSAIHAHIQHPSGDAPAGQLVLISIALSFLALLAADRFSRSFRKRSRVG